MDATCTWRGPFTSTEVNKLHAEAFGTRLFTDEEWDWQALTATYSLGWVTARVGDRLVGFANVLWDGLVHSWLQDVMVAAERRHHGIGVLLVQEARGGAKEAGCEWLHVDFEPALRPFYVQACGFTPTEAGLMHL